MSETELVYLCSCLDGIDEPFLVISADSELLFANRALFSLLGRDIEESQGLSLQQFWPAFSNSTDRGEIVTEFFSASEESFPVKLSVSETPDGLLIVRVVAGRTGAGGGTDLHLQRMETLGILAGGIAHDVNNILTGILGHASYLLATLPESGAHVESLKAIEDGAKRSAQMTRQIVNFSRSGDEESAAPVDIGAVVESACNLLRGAISKEFRLSYEIPRSPVMVSVIEGQLSQIIINLVINARDALPPRGEIQVTLREADGDADPVAGEALSGISGRFVSLCVSDNGRGIPPALQERIFEPYFSTKAERGTGLGLATVKSIVKQHGGVIALRSKEGVGTRVYVFFPIHDSLDVAVLREGELRESVGGSENILVIDDESSVRNVLSLGLERLGYEVVTAASGTEGIQLFSANPQAFDLVILDMVMPDYSGRDVFFELKKIRSEVKVLLSSAFSSDQAVQSVLKNGGFGFIQKPFSVEELARVVRDCLDRDNK